jgi:OOP family OmpA-OmpF porin
MNKLICLIIVFIICGVCSGQNLVPNPSFEDTMSCPDMLSEINWCMYWHNAGDSFPPDLSTPDYYNTCSTANGIAPPNCNWGYQNPHSGNAFAFINTYVSVFPDLRESIQAALLQSLVIGQKYYVSFYANLPYGTVHALASNKLGALFTTFQFIQPNYAHTINFAHVYTDSLITDTLNWTRISGSFIADSAYTYITISNFFDSAHTKTLNLNSNFNASGYYIDDVCVSTDSLTCNPPIGITEIKNQESMVLFPNPFIDQINITTKINEFVEINLYDITSRKIFNQTFTNSTSINTQQLAKGIYLYEVRNKKGVIKQGKIVKD